MLSSIPGSLKPQVRYRKKRRRVDSFVSCFYRFPRVGKKENFLVWGSPSPHFTPMMMSWYCDRVYHLREG